MDKKSILQQANAEMEKAKKSGKVSSTKLENPAPYIARPQKGKTTKKKK